MASHMQSEPAAPETLPVTHGKSYAVKAGCAGNGASDPYSVQGGGGGVPCGLSMAPALVFFQDGCPLEELKRLADNSSTDRDLPDLEVF